MYAISRLYPSGVPYLKDIDQGHIGCASEGLTERVTHEYVEDDLMIRIWSEEYRVQIMVIWFHFCTIIGINQSSISYFVYNILLLRNLIFRVLLFRPKQICQNSKPLVTLA